MRDKLIFDKIKEAIKILDEIDDLIESQGEALQKVDYELSDLYHLIENNNIDKESCVNVILKIKELRIERRSLQKEHVIEKAYKDNASKMMGNNTRQFLMNEVQKALSSYTENEYKNRVLTEEDINVLLKPSMKKRGRPRKESDYNGN